MKINRQILASALLILLGIILVADLHVLGHDDEGSHETDCSICDFNAEHHSDDYIPMDIVINYEIIQIPMDIVQINYINRYFAISPSHSFLNKAPPAA